MSFKEFSSSHNAPTKAKPEAKTQDAPMAGGPSPVEPAKQPAEVAPGSKP